MKRCAAALRALATRSPLERRAPIRIRGAEGVASRAILRAEGVEVVVGEQAAIGHLPGADVERRYLGGVGRRCGTDGLHVASTSLRSASRSPPCGASCSA